MRKRLSLDKARQHSLRLPLALPATGAVSPAHRHTPAHQKRGRAHPGQGASQQDAGPLSLDQVLDDPEAPQGPGARWQGLAEPQLDVGAHHIGGLRGQRGCYGCQRAGCEVHGCRGPLFLPVGLQRESWLGLV